jgi:hypothetical protein
VTAVRALALAAAAALASCALLPRAPEPTTMEGEWAQKRDAETRRAFLYDGLKHRATATATHLSLAVREARARRLAEWYGWTPAELDHRLAQERKDAAEREEFLVSFYTAESHYNDLDGLRTGWRVALKVEGTDLLPRRITALDRETSTLGLFPYVGPFDTIYQVVVPMPAAGPVAGRPFALEIASALGKLSIDFSTPNGTITPQEPVPPP